MTRPGVLIRFVGRAPVQATVYRLQKLRCNLCGKIFAAPAPEGVNKQREYDVTVGSIIALLKYGSGLPFNRLEGLQWNFGIPLPASTQWDIVHNAAKPLSPILKELIRQAALGDIVYNDDTTVRVLDWMGLRAKQKAFKEDTDEIVLNKDGSQRCGMYTTGIVSTCENWRIALFFTGRRHAGENLMKVLGQRSDALPPPIQMCDPLPHNMPDELQTILSNCLAHGRRQFVDVVDNFPKEVEHVLRALKEVYKNDATARKGHMSPEARLRFHQAESGPIMKDLREWMTRQIDQRLVEPNSGLGEAISYMTKRWDKFTLFLREAGAPLDNNICERALKKAILHRKNSYFYKTLNGAHVGDLFMSLIYTCELCKVNAFDYLTELLRHADQLAANPERWMPWNYRQTTEDLTESAVVVG
jgi:transposase